MAKKSLKSYVKTEQKRRSDAGRWHGRKHSQLTNAERQRLRLPELPSLDNTVGRKRGTPNLKKIDGKLVNQHGVSFTETDKKRLVNEVNKANQKRMRMLEYEANLHRKVGGVDTGDTVRSLQNMGKESDFILARKSKSLQQFKTGDDYERYIRNLEHVNSPTYLDERTRAYKRNHITALENAFGDEAKDVMMKIRMMKPAEYRELIQSDEDLEISYIYDPSARTGRLNKIRAALGMKEKDEEIFEE